MLKLGAPSGESMLIAGRTLSRHRRVPRMWQARIRIEKNTGSLQASESPKPSSTKRAKASRLLRGSRSGMDDLSAVECVRSWRIEAQERTHSTALKSSIPLLDPRNSLDAFEERNG